MSLVGININIFIFLSPNLRKRTNLTKTMNKYHWVLSSFKKQRGTGKHPVCVCVVYIHTLVLLIFHGNIPSSIKGCYWIFFH